MIDTPASAIAEIRRLGLPDMFREVMEETLADDETVPAYLRWNSKFPRVYFGLCHDLAERVPDLKSLCPLWQENGEAIIGRLADGSYVEFYYEDAGLENPETSVRVLGKNYQQFVTTILTRLAEAGLWKEYATEVGNTLEFKHLKELENLLEAWTEEHVDKELDRFRDSLV